MSYKPPLSTYESNRNAFITEAAEYATGKVPADLAPSPKNGKDYENRSDKNRVKWDGVYLQRMDYLYAEKYK